MGLGWIRTACSRLWKLWRRHVAVSFIFAAAVIVVSWQSSLSSQRQDAFAPVPLHPSPSTEPISAIPQSLPLDEKKVALGERLFHDPQLSRDNSLACANCHGLRQGGADGRRRSSGIDGQLGDTNAPTVFNSGFNVRQFWNGRAASLEDQVDGPVHNAKELGSNWTEIVAKLKRDPAYVAQFSALYRAGLRPESIRDAIAAFERSLITPNSRFDKYLNGERDALTADEITGYQLFKSYGCIACHQGVNVGGNLYERLGIAGDYFEERGMAAPADLGRFSVTGKPEDRHVFKVPGLRNVALTAPYFHDGSVDTLEQAVEIMAKYQLGVSIQEREVALIVRFLHTLTGEYRGKPL